MPANPVKIVVNGRSVETTDQTSVAAALLAHGEWAVRRAVTGEPRAPLCGMGVCFECRATIDGELHMRTCLILCRDGMEVRTGG